MLSFVTSPTDIIGQHFQIVCQGTEKILEVLTTVAKDLKGETLFVTIDADVADHKNVMDYFGFKQDALPIYLVFEVRQR